MILKLFAGEGTLQIWTNHAVPPNDGGISLGQAALAALAHPACNKVESASLEHVV